MGETENQPLDFLLFPSPVALLFSCLPVRVLCRVRLSFFVYCYCLCCRHSCSVTQPRRTERRNYAMIKFPDQGPRGTAHDVRGLGDGGGEWFGCFTVEYTGRSTVKL